MRSVRVSPEPQQTLKESGVVDYELKDSSGDSAFFAAKVHQNSKHNTMLLMLSILPPAFSIVSSCA